jgi:anti-sigma factor RsiW
MTCDEVRSRIDDYVDGELDEAAFQEIELHLAGCGECRAEERSLRALLAHATALPRERTPGRDLWAGIEERLDEARPSRGRVWTMAGWGAGLAAAAGVVLALSATLGGPAPPASSSPRPSGTASLAPVALGTEEPVMAAERAYARAAVELMAALQEQRDRLPPETLASLERDLRSIDAALLQVQLALASDPANPRLNHLLASTHQKKVEMLQQVLRLSRT